jgi:hypothetical protein
MGQSFLPNSSLNGGRRGPHTGENFPPQQGAPILPPSRPNVTGQDPVTLTHNVLAQSRSVLLLAEVVLTDYYVISNVGLKLTCRSAEECAEDRESPLMDGTGPLVSFARSGIAAHWKASADQSILELAEACVVPVRWSCRTGVCYCESGLVSGAVVYGPEPLEKPAEGNLLVCCSQPIRDVVIDL